MNNDTFCLYRYTISYLPGGVGTLQVGSRMIARQVLPI